MRTTIPAVGRLASATVGIVLIASWAANAAADEPKKNRALLIGVSKYKEYVENLLFPEQDAIAMKDLFVEANYDVVQIHGGEATKQRIEQELNAVAAAGNSDGVQIIGLFGHGVQYGDDVYFLPWDTRGRAVIDAAGRKLFDRNGQKTEPDPATLVSLREILVKLGASRARSKLLIGDFCRDDRLKARDGNLEPSEPAEIALLKLQEIVPQGTVALLACQEGEQAFEDLGYKHGLFTQAFLDVCRAEAGNDITFDGIVAHLKKRVPEAVAKLDPNRRQNPHLISNGVVRLDLKGIAPGKPLPQNGLWPPLVPIANKINMNLVEIPAGEFMMGSNDNKDTLRKAGFFVDFKGFNPDDEAPAHRVRITRPFLMSQTEVTIGQFTQFYDAEYRGRLDCQKDGKGGTGFRNAQKSIEYTDGKEFDPWNWGHDQINMSDPNARQISSEYPIVNVSWNDATAFCKWLSRLEKKTYRLPTEAEWEYACRAGTRGQFWNGNEPARLIQIAKIANNALAEGPGAINLPNKFRFTAPVKSYPPNPFGLYDMHGNVAEWCSDWYDAQYYEVSPVDDPKGPGDGKQRVWRGGGFTQNIVCNRSALRDSYEPTQRQCWIGFRVVCEIDEPATPPRP